MTKSKWRRVDWRKVLWLDTNARRRLAEAAEYAPEGELGDGLIHIDRLEVPVEGLKERIEKLDRMRDGNG